MKKLQFLALTMLLSTPLFVVSAPGQLGAQVKSTQRSFNKTMKSARAQLRERLEDIKDEVAIAVQAAQDKLHDKASDKFVQAAQDFGNKLQSAVKDATASLDLQSKITDIKGSASEQASQLAKTVGRNANGALQTVKQKAASLMQGQTRQDGTRQIPGASNALLVSPAATESTAAQTEIPVARPVSSSTQTEAAVAVMTTQPATNADADYDMADYTDEESAA